MAFVTTTSSKLFCLDYTWDEFLRSIRMLTQNIWSIVRNSATSAPPLMCASPIRQRGNPNASCASFFFGGGNPRLDPRLMSALMCFVQPIKSVSTQIITLERELPTCVYPCIIIYASRIMNKRARVMCVTRRWRSELRQYLMTANTMNKYN